MFTDPMYSSNPSPPRKPNDFTRDSSITPSATRVTTKSPSMRTSAAKGKNILKKLRESHRSSSSKQAHLFKTTPSKGALPAKISSFAQKQVPKGALYIGLLKTLRASAKNRSRLTTHSAKKTHLFTQNPPNKSAKTTQKIKDVPHS